VSVNQTYQQPDLWGNVPKEYPPVDYTANRGSNSDYLKSLSAVRRLLTDVLKTLAEHGEILKDHTAMLDELADMLNDDGN
jgi:hypothetical protein